MTALHFGEVHGFPAPREFPTRRAAQEAGVHGKIRLPISAGQDGVDAVYISGKYEDEEFSYDLVTCPGRGGMAWTLERIADHELTEANLQLVRTYEEQKPVRILVRKSMITGRSMDKAIVYAGLYYVSRWDWVDREDYKWLLFQFEAAPGTAERLELAFGPRGGQPSRTQVTTNRIDRDPGIVREVKALYKDTCQICKKQLKTAIGTYSEAAHIRPLGRPHNGFDRLDNILCLCPNCHKQFDGHALRIDGDRQVFELNELMGKLEVHRRHKIDPSNLLYHWESSSKV